MSIFLQYDDKTTEKTKRNVYGMRSRASVKSAILKLAAIQKKTV